MRDKTCERRIKQRRQRERERKNKGEKRRKINASDKE